MTATLIIENGTGKADSNTYVSASELSTYADERGITISGTSEDLLIKAMDYLEGLDFKGRKNTRAQALQWPRWGVWVDGYPVDSNDIPTILKEAQMQLAVSIDGGYDPLEIIEPKVTKEKVDVIEIEYNWTGAKKDIDPRINNKLKKLLKAGPGVFRVEKD